MVEIAVEIVGLTDFINTIKNILNLNGWLLWRKKSFAWEFLINAKKIQNIFIILLKIYCILKLYIYIIVKKQIIVWSFVTFNTYVLEKNLFFYLLSHLQLVSYWILKVSMSFAFMSNKIPSRSSFLNVNVFV